MYINYILTFAIYGITVKIVFRDLDIHFRFQMFKIFENRSFLYVAGNYNYEKNQKYTFKHLQSNSASLVYLLHELDLHFKFQMLKICEIRSFSYVGVPELKL